MSGEHPVHQALHRKRSTTPCRRTTPPPPTSPTCCARPTPASASSWTHCGLTTDGQPVCVDLDTEPHVLVCAATGGGTTTLLRTLTTQLLHHGAHALVLDLKRISHSWARGVPGVTYCRDIAEIHDGLVALRAELHSRLDHVDQHGDADDLPRLTVVFEVADHTLHQLARHWDAVREKGDPKTSPAIHALERLLFAGLQVRMHVFFNGQLSNTPEWRERFSTVVLGRVTTRTWERLAPQATPTTEGNTHPGRVHVVQGLTAHPTQVLLLTDAEAAASVPANAEES
ncbi:helicase HerA domain-containing protein [Streptomyces lavendulae]|uniref:helicase HerA domain-containing protein n=1 Tax=Streptomyces lavendulae TaxID=1914 RepID=UPI0033F51AE4